VSQDLLKQSSLSAAALQRVLKSVETATEVNVADYELLGPMTKRMVDGQLQRKGLQLQPLSGRGGWWSVLAHEPYTGAWQRNNELRADTALSFSAVFACTTLIMGDVGKTALRLVEQDANDIWVETENPAYSPVLRKPNRYQNWGQFANTWTASILNSGNTYVLRVTDGRGVVVAMYVLDPSRVTPLVSQDGAVYYELKRDDLSGLSRETVTVPASEIIHDRMNCLFHPLVGLSPIFACALAAQQGLAIQNNSNTLFQNGSIPGGVLTAPGAISNETAGRLAAYWNASFTGANVGKVAVLGDGLEYKGMAWNAVDLQLVEQLKLTGETVCTAYKVPPYLVDIGPAPPYANAAPVIQKYYNQCLQVRFHAMESCLDEGLRLGRQFGNRFGTEFDPDDLIWMDSAAKSKAAQDGIGSGGMSPNEARKKYYALGPVKGGDSPMVQQQYYSLAALAERDANKPFAKPAAAPAPQVAEDEDDEAMDMAAAMSALKRKSIAAGLYAA
jgi:HK97 family phage portal protein